MISFAAVLSIAYVAACGLLWATQESLLFFPRALAHPPTHPAAESVEIERPDALLRGWVVNAGQAGPVIVYFGGNAEEVSVNIGDFAELRATTVLINYRGYGESTGKPSEQHLVGDAIAVSEWARERFSGRPLVLFGSSLGTGIAVLAAAQVGPDAAVLLSPYRSIARVAQKHFRVFPVRWMIRHPFRAESVLGAMPPTLVIASRKDEIIPYGESLEMVRAMRAVADSPPVEFHSLDVSHNWIRDSPELWEAVDDYLGRLSQS